MTATQPDHPTVDDATPRATKSRPIRDRWPTGIAWAMFLVVVLIVVSLTGIGEWATLPDTPEIQMGMVTVLALSVLIMLIYLMAAGFSSYRLSTPKHALGLPDGSIRALIALFLIVIFVMVSVYLFRSISGRTGAVLPGLTAVQVAALGDRLADVAERRDTAGVAIYDVTLRAGVTPAGEQLALQLVTILGTLVTAVAAFYFGSAAVTSAKDDTREALLAVLGRGTVTIVAIDPATAKAGTARLQATITGTGFIAGAGIRLENEKEKVAFPGTDVVVHGPTRIACNFDLGTAKPGLILDLVVTSPGGQPVTKEKALEITA